MWRNRMLNALKGSHISLAHIYIHGSPYHKGISAEDERSIKISSLGLYSKERRNITEISLRNVQKNLSSPAVSCVAFNNFCSASLSPQSSSNAIAIPAHQTCPDQSRGRIQPPWSAASSSPNSSLHHARISPAGSSIADTSCSVHKLPPHLQPLTDAHSSDIASSTMPCLAP